MDALERYRRAQQQRALRPLGVAAGPGRVFACQVGVAGAEAEISRLPARVAADVEPNQFADGTNVFMFGFSAFSTDDGVLPQDAFGGGV